MKYSYNLYLKNAFFIPLIVVILLIAFIILDCVLLMKDIKSNQTKSIGYYVFSLAVSVLILCIFGNALIRIGFPLLSDKKAETQVVSGEVTNITYSFYSARYYLNGQIYRGVWVEIEGQKYYLIDMGNIQIGNDVRIQYLPNSHFVMECNQEGE